MEDEISALLSMASGRATGTFEWEKINLNAVSEINLHLNFCV